MAKADSPTKTCERPDCGRPVRARGLCSTHYNHVHQPDRHRPVSVPCGWCAKPCPKPVTKRYAERYCSYPCRTAAMRSSGHMQNSLEAARAATASRPARAVRALRKAARGSRGTTPWTAGPCGRCLTLFIAPPGATRGRYCSRLCKNLEKMRRRRARQRGAATQPYSRIAVFRRDGWRCHLCSRRVVRRARVPHPLAPVIDHLVPLACGGDDVLNNVATAHFLCNSRRREVGPAQLLLFGSH